MFVFDTFVHDTPDVKLQTITFDLAYFSRERSQTVHSPHWNQDSTTQTLGDETEEQLKGIIILWSDTDVIKKDKKCTIRLILKDESGRKTVSAPAGPRHFPKARVASLLFKQA